ncbi:hypothetical protein [Paenibacillus assamensis]|uniref:hypothetical protein n=1 Tax=Paenibacillus assamensis TaxID=311244 RepID=UPI0003FDE1A1|nr:hypothetical protein [Paenibacillus assamensis]
MKKRIFLIFAALTLVLTSLVSAAPSTTIVEAEHQERNSNVVYLNGQPVNVNDTIIATPNNQEQLVEKYGLQKPSADAQLVSIRIVHNDSPSSLPNEQSAEKNNAPMSLLGYRMVKNSPQLVDGWQEIARGKYFCNRPKTQTCDNIQIDVNANQSVTTSINTSFGVGYDDVISAEFGVSVGHTVGVATTVKAYAPPIPGGRTFIAVGYPIYQSTFFTLYKKGIFSDTLLGTGTFLLPQPSSIAVTDWIQ